MLDRLKVVNPDGYQRLEPQRQYVSFLDDDFVSLKNDSDKLIKVIKDNVADMKLYTTQYGREATSSREKQAFEAFKSKQRQNFQKIQRLQDNVKRIQKLVQKNDKKLTGDKLRMQQAEAQRYIYELRTCLQMHLQENNGIEVQVQRKKETLNKNLKGTPLEEILLGNYSEQLKNYAWDIQAKIKQIEKLAQSVRECVLLLKQIAFLVEQSQNALDLIEDNVNEAKRYAQKAQPIIAGAARDQARRTRKRCCIIVIGLLVILAILAILFGLDIVHIR